MNAGSGGAVIATDDDGTAHHQYVKLEFGADNTQTKVTSAVGLPVADAGGSLTVDNAGTFAVQAAQSGTWNVGTVTTVTTVSTVTNMATIGTSVTPGTSAAHLGKAEDAIHGSGDTGVMALAVRNDAGTTTFCANGDYSPIAVGAGGQVLTQELGRAAIIQFQTATSTTPAALASNACKEATVKNLLSNSIIVYLGSSAAVSSSNGYELNPGDSVTLKVSNTNLIFAVSASGTPSLCTIATN